MLRARHFLMALALVTFPLGCTPVGCSGEDPEQDKSADEQFVGAVEQKLPAPTPGVPSLYGTWTGAKNTGKFDLLVLMTNGWYHSSDSVVCVKAPCEAGVHDGPFKLYGREGRTYIELTMKGAETQRFEYAVSDNNLRLRPLVAGSEWFALDHSGTAWCQTARECTYQNLPPGVCAGGYVCEQSGCSWKCTIGGGGEPQAAPNTGATDTVKTGDTKTP